VWTTVARLNELGISVDLYEPDALAREFPQFELSGIGIGAFESDAGYADPTGTTMGLAAAAVLAGAELRSWTDVVGLSARQGGGAHLRLADGSALETDRVLIAAGPWTAPLARQLGVELPLTVERHVVAMARLDHVRGVPFGHSDLGAGYYCRPEGSDQYCIGWTHEAEGVDPDRFDRAIHADEEIALLQAAAQRLRALEDAQPRRGWASLYDVSPDWQPVIGEIVEASSSMPGPADTASSLPRLLAATSPSWCSAARTRASLSSRRDASRPASCYAPATARRGSSAERLGQRAASAGAPVRRARRGSCSWSGSAAGGLGAISIRVPMRVLPGQGGGSQSRHKASSRDSLLALGWRALLSRSHHTLPGPNQPTVAAEAARGRKVKPRCRRACTRW
jgi:hypothetical protein